MKNFLIVGLSFLSLSACDTLSNIKMPEMPFGGAKDTVTETNINADASAIDVEMSEMERLMGNQKRFDTQTPEIMPSVPVEPVVAAAINNPIPTNKPAPVIQEQQIEIAKKIETTKKTVTPTPTIDPVTIIKQNPMPDPVFAPKPMAENKTVEIKKQDLKLSSARGCPQIEILPAARSITYFENELSGSMVARAIINEIRGGCDVMNDGVEIDLDIFMSGKISDLGRFEGKKNMEAFMTFPYFVAVSTPQGLPVDKKILATAMRFKPLINDLKHAEKITQFIPMKNTDNAANYKILIGFQLNRKQMEYNRAQLLGRADNKRISPDTIPAATRSKDPLAN